ncbi:hypothetical protein SEA_MSAY19_34 [Gordonia phage Msay19]|uniref:Glycine-rich domain-containing protein n=1 Tax=Gordonia phage Msay19 TaxID=2510507 RepID=A0A411CRE7_9CAUD|nr:hypothetical protein SEA_MSAY19_34 [Gordonia phage Msay19]
MTGWSPEGPPIEGYSATWATGEGPGEVGWEVGWGNLFPVTAADEVLFEDAASVKALISAVDEVIFETDAWVSRRPSSFQDEVLFEEYVSAYISKLSSYFVDEVVFEEYATARFAPMAPQSTTYSTVGTFTYTIPPWCRYIDAVGIGGGRGGQTGNGASTAVGRGGLPGQWAATTLERGVHIPWSESQLTVVVGAGGAGGANSDHAAGQNGSPSSITSSAGTLTAPGGTGTSSATLARDGVAAGDYTYLGITYTGGGTAGENGEAGKPPGGGGAGGNGGIFGNRTRGGAGARGQVNMRAYQ